MENNNALIPGTRLRGKSYTYTIDKMLGQGTFGITYLATTQVKVAGALGELETTIQVTIKEFFMRDINGREENTVTCGSKGGVYYDYRKKFSREAANLSKLHHPHIVKVLEYFEANNTVYYAMEYLEGGSLDTYIEQQEGLTEAECIKYAGQIGSALSYMHAHKMLHLDLKPGNVMLRKNKEAVLIDFGLSKQYDESGKPETSTSVGSGTPGYAPIEQSNYHDGNGFPVTMDVYALGATMYKMLTGVRPPDAPEILNDGFPAYELQKHRVSDALISAIARAMSAMKKDRPQSVAAFLETLNGENTIVASEEDADTAFEDDVVTASTHTDDVPKDDVLTDNIPTGDISVDDVSAQKSREKKKNIIFILLTVLLLGIVVIYSASGSGEPSDKDIFESTVEAAESGNAQAQFELGDMYFYGYNGAPENTSLAITWYQKAAEQGYMKAIDKLINYYESDNVQDYIEAARCWYRKAELGDADAQYRIGWMYEIGKNGMQRNRPEAIKWYRKAAAQGHDDAKDRLQELEKKSKIF